MFCTNKNKVFPLKRNHRKHTFMTYTIKSFHFPLEDQTNTKRDTQYAAYSIRQINLTIPLKSDPVTFSREIPNVQYYSSRLVYNSNEICLHGAKIFT